MAVSLRAFKIELYQEHLEEAAFLYQQRLALFRDPETSWLRIGEFEDRLEAHVDALVVGEELALEVCRERVSKGEPAELFPIVSVFCRQRRAEFLSELFAGVDLKDPEKIRPVEDALKHELPREWSGYCEQALSRCPENLTAILGKVVGYQRLPLAQHVARVLADGPPAARASMAWALGRLRSAASTSLLPCLRDDNVAIKSAALQALLRSGVRDPLHRCELIAQKETWPLLALALGGSRSVSEMLLGAVRSGSATSDCMLGLGLLGDLSAVRLLYDYLPHTGVGASAALALELITGAKLYDQVFVPEAVVEEELFEDELKAWNERGEAPKHVDGRPFGVTVTQLTPSQAKWRAWLSTHSKEFDSNLRYRNGKPYSPDSLLENLLDDRTPHFVRQVVGEELVIRYGCDVPFEADMPVARQLRALLAIADWIKANGGRFQPGVWYFGGQPV